MTFGIYEKPAPHAEDALMAGETDVAQWPLDQMRRQQLHDLALAYELPVEKGGTKTDILIGMKPAQKSGVFKLPPKHPEHARKAMQDSDQAAEARSPGRNNFGA